MQGSEPLNICFVCLHPRLQLLPGLLSLCCCRLQAPRTVLLYGPHGSGKTMLALAAAQQAGATLFDLSPAATAGKYAGKAAATMVHMVSRAGLTAGWRGR